MKYMTAQEAADRLNIKHATLYAYVSRRLIRSELTEDGSRERRYFAEDVEKLATRKDQRRNPAKVAQEALHWGAPVMDSALTLIVDGSLYYRGYDAVELAKTHSFEQVAAMLWLGDFEAAASLFARAATSAPKIGTLPAIQSLQIALAQASADDLSAYTLESAAVAKTGARILKLMTAVITGDQGMPIAETLAAAWRTSKAQVLNAALILCADHELNASSFTARVVASTEATPYAAVTAGLAALQGYKHGRNTERVSALLREVGEARYARTVIAERLQRGEWLPGFGHWLYPEGDPRARALLNMLYGMQPDHEALALLEAVRQETEAAIGKAPNVDFALAGLEMAFHLPRGAALTLFALGRTAGWIAHAIEQYASGEMVRPRARYVGRLPSPA